MVKRVQVGWAAGLLALCIFQPTLAESAKTRAPVDLSARLLQAQADPKLEQALLTTGRKVAAVCANCHGEGGNSVKPDIPNLAGQNPAYLLEQVRQFADGRRRDMFMEGMIRAMNSDEKVGMVLFYTSQQVVHTPLANAALAAKGQEYFNKVCFRCHGTDGRGSAQFPRIAGQQINYLTQTLKRYRSGGGTRADSVMVTHAKSMTDADIQAVVAFVSSMQ
ncbi:c-type cytochrome [Simplicispira psychrophila]|uniref:c-type cytochrome n=1 Tax=Simplicispira psychrophila TaxID=80882 RepID=UPI0004843419|nr:c-type cytochrome [Simplicispira psychrophila]